MKKVFTFILMCTLSVSCLVGCSNSDSKSSDNTENTSTGNAESKGSDGTENTGAEFTTVTSGKLTMVTNAEFPPYEYYEGEDVVGIDAEVAGLIAEKLGLELEIVDTAFDSIIPGVQSGKYDMGMAGMTVDEKERKV